jgi:hypothetical protein
MGKAKHKHPKVKCIEVTDREIRDLLDRVEQRTLLEQDYDLIKGITETVRHLRQVVDDNAASIKRLLGYMFGSPTETAKKIFPEGDSIRPEPPRDAERPREPRKGHGRLGADRYTGGSLVRLPHPSLVPGAPCPECPKGKVYELAMPSTFVRIVGAAPLQSTVFELSRLRCNLCGQIFSVLPVGVHSAIFFRLAGVGFCARGTQVSLNPCSQWALGRRRGMLAGTRLRAGRFSGESSARINGDGLDPSPATVTGSGPAVSLV